MALDAHSPVVRSPLIEAAWGFWVSVCGTLLFEVLRPISDTGCETPCEEGDFNAAYLASGAGLEVGCLAGKLVGVRDSMHPHGAMLRFTPAEWNAFIGGQASAFFHHEKSRPWRVDSGVCGCQNRDDLGRFRLFSI